VGGWCCVPHSITSADQTLNLVADSLIEWRQWLEDLAARFERLLPTLDPAQRPADLVVAWEIAVAQLVVTVVDRTEAESGWYYHCSQVLMWLLTAAGIAEQDRAHMIVDAIGGRFHSWSEPTPPDVSDTAERLAHLVTGQRMVAPTPPARPTDDLSAWLSVRERIDWRTVTGPARGPARGDRDAVEEHARQRDTDDGGRLSAAVAEVRRAAAAGGPLTFALLAQWQRTVLAVDAPGFRTGPAYAKRTRESYAWWPELPARFDDLLAEATDDDVPLPARAARVYLDVAFVHPFDDGNARAAMLALYYVLAREDVVLDHAAPLLRVSRVAHDKTGPAGLAGLVEVLINSTRRRMWRGTSPVE
jgi:hypothetical protein